MAISTADKFLHVGQPGTATTLSAPGYTAGGSTMNVASTGSFPTDTAVIFSVDTVGTSSGSQVENVGSYCVFVGIVTSATSIGSVSLLFGTPQNYAAAATTRVFITVSSEHTNRLVDGILTQHNQDGSHGAVTATSVTATGTVQGATVISTGDIQLRNTSLETIRNENQFNFIASGCVWSGDSYGSTRNASMTSGVVYIAGKRLTVAAVTARLFTASKDTYVDYQDNGDGTATVNYSESTNNAASQAIPNSKNEVDNIRGAIIITGASNIANAGSVNQGEPGKVLPIASSIPYETTDSLGYLIAPRDPGRQTLAYRNAPAKSTTSTSDVQVDGASLNFYVTPAMVGRRMRARLTHATGTNATGNLYVSPALWLGTVGSGTLLGREYAIIPNAGNLEPLQLTGYFVPTVAGMLTLNLGVQVQGGTGGINKYGGEAIVVELV